MGAVALAVSGNQISSDFLMARSTAACGPTVGGASALVNLVINGQAITVTGAANQTVALPNGSATINEQVPTVGATSGELIIRALHVRTHDTVTGQPIADVSLASAEAKIDCAGGSSPGEDWISGGGWIPGASGTGKATFGFVAGPGGNPNRGHLTLKDHGMDQAIHATVINSMTNCSAGFSLFEATDTDGNLVQVEVQDNGEFGTADTFTITAGPYNNTGVLISGNIQAHGFSCQ
jgi:hypothetical protein